MDRIKHYYQLPRDANPGEIGRSFLWAEGYLHGNDFHIKYYRRDFYVYEGTHYKEIHKENLLVEILAFLQDQKALASKATTSTARNILMNIAAIVKVPDEIETPCFLSATQRNGGRLISFQNGILDLDSYMMGKIFLMKHTPDFFSFNSLPFSYKSKAKCPTWRNFLDEVLPDPNLQMIVQEWFGYNLTYDTSHQKFVIMVGLGGDGKSVIANVLEELLGEANVSSVSLEQFDPSRTFPLYDMIGKLANITREVGDLNKVAEGVLKTVVAGEKMTLERKGRDPSLEKFTAKLTFLTNVVPRFRDRTEGLWRRVLFVPFGVQTLDPKKQNRNLVKGSWWIQSGELQGVMNWALAGMVRLTKRGYFVEPKASLNMKAEYKEEANPAATFLLENYEIKNGGNLNSNELYSKYAQVIRAQGGTPLGKGLFTREVKNIFRKARLSVNPRVVSKPLAGVTGSIRARVWENVRRKP
jgi:putative DNA primase/helicase